MKGVVVDQHGAEQRLLSFDVVRRPTLFSLNAASDTFVRPPRPMLKCRTYEEQRIMQGVGDELPSSEEV